MPEVPPNAKALAMSDLVQSLRRKLRMASQEIGGAGKHIMRGTPLDTALDQLRDTLRDANEILDELHPVERRREDRPDALRLGELAVPHIEETVPVSAVTHHTTMALKLRFKDAAELDTLPGAIEPSNPVKWLVHQFLNNAQGRAIEIIVQFEQPSLDDYLTRMIADMGVPKKYYDPEQQQ